MSGSFVSSVTDGQQVENGHANGNPVQHLLEYDGVLAVGDIGCDLHVPIDRPGMQDGDHTSRAIKPLPRNPVVVVVLAKRRKEPACVPLELDAQDVQDITELTGQKRLLD